MAPPIFIIMLQNTSSFLDLKFPISRACTKVPELKNVVDNASAANDSDFSYTELRTILPALLKIKKDETSDPKAPPAPITAKSLIDEASKKACVNLKKRCEKLHP